MLNRKVEVENAELIDVFFDLDIEAIVVQVWENLQKKVPQSNIRQAVINILPKYQNARIKSYLFILIQREVTALLKKQIQIRIVNFKS